MKPSEMFSMMKGFLSDYLTYRGELRQHDAWIKKYAGHKNYRVNPHWMFYTNLKIWIAESAKTFGQRFCPCFEPGGNAALNKRLLCPCDFAAAEIDERGVCHCVLFGRENLTDADFKIAEARLMQEYRGVPLKFDGEVLDTRGMPRDPLRGLPIPDSLHQVKRALGSLHTEKLVITVDTLKEAENLESYARLKGFGYKVQENDGVFRVTLKTRR